MSTEFQRSEGHVHTGAGDQWNLTVNLAEQVRRTRRGAGAWSETAFLNVRARFYSPEGFGDLREDMEVLKILVLKGKSGSGRRFAALELLHKSEYSRGLFYAPAVGDEDEEKLGNLKPEAGDRYLLDLSTMSREAFNLVARDVQPFFKLVLEAGARSVLILPDDCEPDADWQSFVRTVVPPDPVGAYKNHLRSIDIEFDDLDVAGVREHFQHAPMSDMDRLRELVQDARRADPTRDYRAWTTAALDALRDGAKDVAALLKDLSAGQQRALLLSASLFAGGSADGAWHAAKVLLGTLKYPENPDHPLDQSDLQEQLAVFGARIDQNRRLQFKKPLDAAIRAYLWDGYPALRSALAQWMSTLICGSKGPPSDIETVVTRFAEQHLRTRQTASLIGLIAALADAGAGDPAFLLLKQGLEHPEHGREFRVQTREWAKGTLSVGLGEVLIQACSEVIRDTYPDQGLVRLHHLARKPGPIGAMACREIAAQFGNDRLRRLIRALLSRMIDYPHERDPFVFVSVIDPFEITDAEGRPRPLVAEVLFRSHLTQVWRATLHVRPEGWRPCLDRWLSAAGLSHRDALLAILAEAPDDLATRSLLYSAALDWATARGGARQTVDDLLNRINTAQGISFAPRERTD